MRRSLIAGLGLAVALIGCEPGNQGEATSPGPTTPAGATQPADGAAAGFCEAAARLPLADASNRQEIQAGLEAATPSGLAAAVGVVRMFMERQASGDDPFKDPTFLLEYDRAVRDILEECGIG